MKGTSVLFLGLCLTARAGSAQDVQAGIAHYQQGRYAEAEATLRQASGAEASAYLAASLAKQKKYAEAEGPANAAVQANPTHEVAIAALGESLVGLKKFDEAITRMAAALQAKGDLAYAFFWRAQAYQNKQQVARMVEDYQAFLKLAPNAPEAPSVKVLLQSFR